MCLESDLVQFDSKWVIKSISCENTCDILSYKLRSLLLRFVDIEKDNSFINRLRAKRISIFKRLISCISKPILILDVGGEVIFWDIHEFNSNDDLKITILNIKKFEVHHSNIKSVIGDARDMYQYQDKEFDVVFSNSVIEHVGTYKDQMQMAKEVSRIGKRFFIQTPNFYFPIEPHFLFPFFQFLPLRLRVFLVQHFDLGNYNKIPNKKRAYKIVTSIRLLKEQELKELFPSASILKEKMFGITYSFIVYNGWNNLKIESIKTSSRE